MSYFTTGRAMGALGDANIPGSQGTCGQSTSTAYPAGLTPAGRSSGPGKICAGLAATAPAIAQLCNASIAPLDCYYAKFHGKTFMGRGSMNDVPLWQQWVPSALPAHDAGAPPVAVPVSPPTGSSDTLLYVGLGVVALAAVAAAIHFSKGLPMSYVRLAGLGDRDVSGSMNTVSADGTQTQVQTQNSIVNTSSAPSSSYCSLQGGVQKYLPGKPPAGWMTKTGKGIFGQPITCYVPPSEAGVAITPGAFNVCQGAYGPATPQHTVVGQPPSGWTHTVSTKNGIQNDCWKPPTYTPCPTAANPNPKPLLGSPPAGLTKVTKQGWFGTTTCWGTLKAAPASTSSGRPAPPPTLVPGQFPTSGASPSAALLAANLQSINLINGQQPVAPPLTWQIRPVSGGAGSGGGGATSVDISPGPQPVPTPAPSSFPWVPVGIGAALLLAVGVFVATRHPEENALCRMP